MIKSSNLCYTSYCIPSQLSLPPLAIKLYMFQCNEPVAVSPYFICCPFQPDTSFHKHPRTYESFDFDIHVCGIFGVRLHPSDINVESVLIVSSQFAFVLNIKSKQAFLLWSTQINMFSLSTPLDTYISIEKMWRPRKSLPLTMPCAQLSTQKRKPWIQNMLSCKSQSNGVSKMALRVVVFQYR